MKISHNCTTKKMEMILTFGNWKAERTERVGDD